MSLPESINVELRGLLGRLAEDAMTAPEQQRLDQILATDPQAQQMFADYAMLDVCLEMLGIDGENPAAPFELAGGDESTEDVDYAASSTDHSSYITRHSPSPLPPVIIQPLPSPLSPLPSFIGSPLFSYIMATLIVGLGLVIGAYVYVSQPEEYVGPRSPGHTPNPQSPTPNPSSIVARITGMVDCVWAGDETKNSPLPPLHSPLVALGDRLTLRSGLLEITYDAGARVILQGPVTYEVESPSGGYLSVGKLTAKLEKKPDVKGQRSESANQKSPDLCPLTSDLFAIRTPSATVTDLGTEFGVAVDHQGATNSHVFRGSVRVATIAPKNNTRPHVCVLHEDQSVYVTSQGTLNAVKSAASIDAGVSSSAFIRKLPQSKGMANIRALDLIDVVAGGDGYSGRRNRGIDPTSGRTVHALDNTSIKPQSGDGQYHRVARLPLIDGVFIPGGGEYPVQVDSAGHLFDGFMKTANATHQPIWAAGEMPAVASTIIGALDYASAGHGLLFLHANNAITFDLEAIRQANSGLKLSRFRATASNTCSDVNYCADIWVLVDGKKQFQRRQINRSNGAFPVAVPIRDKDRFLTLAATDGGDGVHFDFIVFGDARLELSPAEKAAGGDD